MTSLLGCTFPYGAGFPGDKPGSHYRFHDLLFGSPFVAQPVVTVQTKLAAFRRDVALAHTAMDHLARVVWPELETAATDRRQQPDVPARARNNLPDEASAVAQQPTTLLAFYAQVGLN